MKRGTIAAGAVIVGALAIGERNARAVDAEVEATTTAQAYQLRGLSGDPVLSRRRVMQTIGLGVYDLTGEKTSDGPQLFFRARMRLDADFGEDKSEWSLAGNPNYARYVPGLQPAPVDIMYGYLEGRKFAHGLVGFRLGRQYVIDPLGFYSFDGGLLRVTTPAYFAVEAYGGFEVRNGMPLSSSTSELAGVQRGDRAGFPANGYPSFQKSGLAPMYGVAIESVGPTWIHGRFTYRKAWNTGQSFVGYGGALLGPDSLGIYDHRRVSSERVGWGGNADLWSFATVRANLIYDLYGQQWSEISAGVDVFASDRWTFGADYEYFKPIFDADSIFNVFGIEPMDDVTGRVEFQASDRLSLEADGMLRRYHAEDPNDAHQAELDARAPRIATTYAAGGGGRVRYKYGTASYGARVTGLSGDEGLRIGGDLIYDRTFLDRYLAEARASVYRFDDKMRLQADGSSRSATSVGYVLAGGYKLSREATTMLQWEHDTNRLVGQRFRIMAILAVRSWL